VSATAAPLSDDFVAAAHAEADRLRLDAERLRARAAEHLRAAEELTRRAIELERRTRELDELLGRSPQLRLDVPSEGLRGQTLRDAAIDVLARRHGLGEPIHYRQWFELLVSEGHRVGGKDPLALFLTQVTRSPVVERAAGDPGVYRVDPASGADRALRAHAEAENELRQAETAFRQAVGRSKDRAIGSRLPESGELERRVKDARRKLAAAERALSEVARTEARLQRAL
jgi:hypothetical protein